MRVFVISDIHGAYRALRQCLMKSGFDYERDHLICLGDVTDGWPETKASVDELLGIKNLIYIMGNHDWWTLEWMLSGRVEDLWYVQGGKATVDSYQGSVPDSHIEFFSKAAYYHIRDNRLFVHAGIDPSLPLDDQTMSTFLWDRTLASHALSHYPDDVGHRISPFDEIYVGHTPIPFAHPIFSLGVWLMDTGAGWSGVLSMMNIHTKEVYTSDPVPELYPGIQGRKREW